MGFVFGMNKMTNKHTPAPWTIDNCVDYIDIIDANKNTKVFTFKPMLAATIKDAVKDIAFPCYVSRKLDGIRCIVIDGVGYSRSLKRIPNLELQELFSTHNYDDLDGELICGEPNLPNTFQTSTSAVMTIKGSADNIKFYVFDIINSDLEFGDRYYEMIDTIGYDTFTVPVHHVECLALSEVEVYEELFLAEGYEGLMVRSPNGKYKCGRSTVKERGLLKLKRFSDSEAIILGFVELQTNLNEKVVNELGNSARSSSKAGKVDSDTLGSLLVKDVTSGLEFNVGSGFTAEQRAEIWNDKELYLGKLITYKFFEVGVVDLPRFPIFKGFRSELDMS